NFLSWLIIFLTSSSFNLFYLFIYFRCFFYFQQKKPPLDNHIQRGENLQLFYKHRGFGLNIASFLQTSRLYFKPTSFNIPMCLLFHCYGFRQIPWLVHIVAAVQCCIVRNELVDDYGYECC